MRFFKKKEKHLGEDSSHSAEGAVDSEQPEQMPVTREMRPFRAEFIIGQLVLITEEVFKILVENGSHTLSHDLDYDSLQRVADRFLGETVGFGVVNGKITKMKPLRLGDRLIQPPASREAPTLTSNTKSTTNLLHVRSI